MKIKKRRIWLSVLLALALAISPVQADLFYAPLVYAQSAEAIALVSRIDGLPPSEDIEASHASEVKALMETYASLPMADQLHVENYDTLKNVYDKLVREGVITNEMQAEIEEQRNLAREQSDKKDSGPSAAHETEYTFTARENNPITIMLRYTTDADGDGITDIPERIIMTAPSGKTYPVSNASLALKDQDLSNALTWTDNYLQMDIAEATPGKWTIQTSIPVTFSLEAYKGAATPITPEDVQDEELADNLPQEPEEPGDDPEPEKERGEFSFGLLMIPVLLLALFFLFRLIKNAPKSQTPSGREGDVIEQPKPLSDEEIMQQMRREYAARQQEEERIQKFEEDDPRPMGGYVPETTRRINPYLDDDLEDLDETIEEDDTIQEYREGDTGLLDHPPSATEGKEEDESIFADFI